MKPKRIAVFLFIALLLWSLTGCGGAADASAVSESGVAAGGRPEASADSAQEAALGAKTTKKGAYQAPPFADAVYHADQAEGDDTAGIDCSAVAEGYVGARAVSDTRLKFQVICGENTYNYDLPSDGTPEVYGLQSGDGDYRFRIMKNTEGSKYVELFATEATVQLEDEFQPFLRPSMFINYNAGSNCVKKASELASSADTELEVVGAVYDYVCANVTYDKEKAATVEKGYVPDLDETLSTGKGICFDYASLAAAMLRSQGIPTRMIFGYVSPGDLYHAWNMFYTEQTGWVTVEFEVKQTGWERLDLTFSANGADNTFVGDGSNYSDLYVY